MVADGQVAPGFTDSILFRQVIGPYQMEQYGLVGGNIADGLSFGKLFHTARPPATPTTAPRPRPLPGRVGHPRQRRHRRHPGRNVVRQITKDLQDEHRQKIRQRLRLPAR